MDAHLAGLSTAIGSKNGKALANFLSFTNQQSDELNGFLGSALDTNNWTKRLEGLVRSARFDLNDSWGAMLLNHCKSRYNFFILDDPENAYRELHFSWKNFLEEYKKENSDWMNPAVCTLITQLRRIATKTDERNGNSSCLEGFQTSLCRPFYSTCSSKPAALVYHLINTLFKTYFKLNNHHRCSELIKQVKNGQLPGLQHCPLSQQVTYHYYEGRLALFELDFEKALEKLTFAFNSCTAAMHNNKRRALVYLIPVQLLAAKCPSVKLLQKYNLVGLYGELISAYKKGDVTALQASLLKQQSTYIRQGTFLVLEKLILLTYRNLFKLVNTVLNPPNCVIPLKKFLDSLQFLKNEKDQEEVECILANLIFRGYIRGYISKEKSCVKFDKNNPFPALSSVPLTRL